MSVIQLGCLQVVLLIAASISSSAIAEIPPNAAEWPTGEGRAPRPQGITGATHDWEIPDSPLDGVTPKITVSIPSEFKLDIDLTIHRADAPSDEHGERFRRGKALAGGLHHLRCRSRVSQAGRHR
jgi:hypothetical protein